MLFGIRSVSFHYDTMMTTVLDGVTCLSPLSTDRHRWWGVRTQRYWWLTADRADITVSKMKFWPLWYLSWATKVCTSCSSRFSWSSLRYSDILATDVDIEAMRHFPWQPMFVSSQSCCTSTIIQSHVASVTTIVIQDQTCSQNVRFCEQQVSAWGSALSDLYWIIFKWRRLGPGQCN